MGRDTLDWVAVRIAEHAAAHSLAGIGVVLHGGEPLLAGAEVISYAVNAIRAAVDRDKRVTVDVQTNGLLLDERFLELFARLDVRVGLSLDGDRDAQDRHRRRPGGRGSYAAVAAAAERLARYPGLFSGFLSVVDLRSDPVRVYESLLRFAPPAIDFLLPHGNWSAPPPGRAVTCGKAPYGEWLATVFDCWYGAREKQTSVRLFEEIMNGLLGGCSAAEQIGTSPVATIVIETDGGMQWSDMVTAAYVGAGATGRNIHTDPFDTVLLAPQIASRQLGIQALSARCRECPVVRVCGGGLYEHRYRAGNGFDNPSVYCPDLYHLITHVRARMAADLARHHLGAA